MIRLIYPINQHLRLIEYLNKFVKLLNMNYKQRLEVRLTTARKGCEPSIGPQNVHIDLNNACNLNCISCWDHSPLLQKKKTVEWKKRLVDTKVLFKTIQELSEMNVERIILSSSGEIFLHPAIFSVITKVKEAGMKLTLISNLQTLTEKQTQWLVDMKVDTILANVSAAKASTYVATHPNQKEQDWDKLLNRLGILSNIRDLKLVNVILNLNFHELPDMIALARSFNAKMQFKLASLSPGLEDLALSENQYEDIRNLVPELIKINPDVQSLQDFALQIRGKKHQFSMSETGCYAGYFYSRITIDGDVLFCCKNFKMGNLNESTFKEIWSNEIYQKFRKNMFQKKFLPLCKSCGNLSLNTKVGKMI